VKVNFFLVFLTVLVLGIAGGRAGTTVESGFDAANKLYAQNKFTEAAAAYLKLIETGSVSPALYFNLGNAFFKSGQIGRAIAAYQQAAALTPRDPDVRANLQFARKQVQGPTVRPGFLQRSLGTLNLNEWAWLCMAGIWTTFGLLIARQIKPALSPVLCNWTLIAALGTVLTVAASATAFFENPTRQLVIVTVHEASVRTSPFDESPVAFSANDGAELRVLDRKDDWVQVTDDARRIGWLKRTTVTL
jgi:tetratricopeptide (TPR) repeat protein